METRAGFEGGGKRGREVVVLKLTLDTNALLPFLRLRSRRPQEIKARIPADILACSAVSREINFSSVKAMNEFKLEQRIFYEGVCIEEWYFDFGFVIPGSTNSWQQIIEAAGEGEIGQGSKDGWSEGRLERDECKSNMPPIRILITFFLSLRSSSSPHLHRRRNAASARTQRKYHHRNIILRRRLLHREVARENLLRVRVINERLLWQQQKLTVHFAP